MSKKTRKNQTTMSLGKFLGKDAKPIVIREKNWTDIVDAEEEEEQQQKKTIAIDLSSLPVAPRASVDIDYSSIPNEPPFTAFVANLSFQVDEENLRRIFAEFQPRSVRVLRDGTRSRGIGLVQFETRENLIEALKRSDKEMFGRIIRVSVADKNNSNQHENFRQSSFQRSNDHQREERTEMNGRWQRREFNSDELSNLKSNRNDFDRSQGNNDYGFGYPRNREDRNHNGRDQQRRGTTRQRYSDDQQTFHNNRDRDDQPKSSNEDQEFPRERRRLQLQPRSKPPEESSPMISGDSSGRINRSIFGGAKPVDTTAKELEIENKLKLSQLNSNDEDQRKNSSSNGNGENNDRNKDFSQTNEYSNRDQGRRRYSRDSSHQQENADDHRYSNDQKKSNDYENNRSKNWSNNRQTNRTNYYQNQSEIENPSRGLMPNSRHVEEQMTKLELSNKFDLLDESRNDQNQRKHSRRDQ